MFAVLVSALSDCGFDLHQILSLGNIYLRVGDSSGCDNSFAFFRGTAPLARNIRLVDAAHQSGQGMIPFADTNFKRLQRRH
jgi:hypothetical protein